MIKTELLVDSTASQMNLNLSARHSTILPTPIYGLNTMDIEHHDSRDEKPCIPKNQPYNEPCIQPKIQPYNEACIQPKIQPYNESCIQPKIQLYNDDEIVKKESETYIIHHYTRPSSISDSKFSLMSLQPASPSHCLSSNIKYCASNSNNGQYADNMRTNYSYSPTSSKATIVQSTSEHTSAIRYDSSPTVLSSTTNKSTQMENTNAPDTTKKSGARRPEKPAISYINMIGAAIRKSPAKRLTLSEIYNHLQNE